MKTKEIKITKKVKESIKAGEVVSILIDYSYYGKKLEDCYGYDDLEGAIWMKTKDREFLVLPVFSGADTIRQGKKEVRQGVVNDHLEFIYDTLKKGIQGGEIYWIEIGEIIESISGQFCRNRTLVIPVSYSSNFGPR